MVWKLLKIWTNAGTGELMYSLSSFRCGMVDQIVLTPTTERDLAKTVAWAQSHGLTIEDNR